MSGRDDVNEQVAGDLYRAYRSSLEATPYGATDQAVLDSAARDGHWRRSPARTFTAWGMLVAALGLVLALTLLPPRWQRITPLSAGASGEQIAPYGDYSVNAALGAAYTQASQLEQATVAMQFNAESQYATLVMQTAAAQSDIHDVTLELLRIQPRLFAVR